MSGLSIDINCDLGESYGRYQVGNDEAVFPYLSSCNIACGYHGGDPIHMEVTIERAIQHKVTIGAHPSYPDKQGFGRRKMHIPGKELKSIIKYQIAALKGMTESKGAEVKYVKPHGALYNSMWNDLEEAKYVIDAIQEIDSKLYLMCLAGSNVEQYAKQNEVPFIAEAFADRLYVAGGTLMSRSIKGSVITDPELASHQVLDIVSKQKIKLSDDSQLDVSAQSICIHGDNQSAVKIAEAIHQLLRSHDIQIKSIFSS